jgi:uncharacterized protein YecT (DUF1311 family)
MIIRSWIMALLLLSGMAITASADCGDKNSRISHLICADARLRALEDEISLRYNTALAQVSQADRPFLKAEQEGWLSRRRLICSKTTEPGSTDDQRRKCLESFAVDDLERLAQWSDLGRMKMLVDAPRDTAACTLALDRKNLSWSRDTRELDLLEPLIPAGAMEPAWAPFGESSHIKYGSFDFLNEGTVRDVYSIQSDEDWQRQFHWYVVVADGEEALVRQRVTALSGDLLDSLIEFGSRFQTERIDRIGHYGFDDVFGDKRKSASLRSMLVTASNSELYRGTTTQNRVVMIDDVAYLIGVDYWRKAALFRPNKDGSLTALCRHDAIPSRSEVKIETFDGRFPCPNGDEGEFIEWEGDQWDMHASLDLKEWGGRRVVVRRLQSYGARYAVTRIFVGAMEVVSPPETNTWQPLDSAAADHDSVEILLTERGAYIVVNDWIPERPDYMPLGVSYYRIVDNGLAEACRTTSVTVPPPGYAVKN